MMTNEHLFFDNDLYINFASQSNVYLSENNTVGLMVRENMIPLFEKNIWKSTVPLE